MPDNKVDDLTKIAKDAAYVTVGLGVIAFQKLQVQRRELEKRLKGQTADVSDQLEGISKLVTDRVKLVEERVQGLVGRAAN
jgi:hypothetical protein